jgi:nitronate monooxygenase/enoyl-[acyl-carrier protein] reductase II
VRAGGGQDLRPFAGQSAALVHDIVPAADLMTRLVAETQQALTAAGHAVGSYR